MLTGLALLQNLWLKSLICLVFSYLIGFFSIQKFIKIAQEKGNIFQPIRSDGPQSHVKDKKKTPTMGGIFIVLSTLITTTLFLDISNYYIWVVSFVFISFAIIGLIDDLMKVFNKNSQGFQGSIKLVVQFMIIGVVFLLLTHIDAIHLKSSIMIPLGDGYWIPLGITLYVLFFTFVIVGTSNAVNLTDGLDGLVSVPVILNLLCLIGLIFVSGDIALATKFKAPYIQQTSELMFFCISLIGAILAFLTFNLKPAKIFMGDVGSLAIGSVLGLVAIIIKQELIFFIISLLFAIEAVSVIMQVGSYKLRKKRIFLMAPIHHHFEKLGWSEQKVVKSFWALSATFSALGIFIFLI